MLVREILEFFKKERLYFYALIGISIFYVFIFFFAHRVSERESFLKQKIDLKSEAAPKGLPISLNSEKQLETKFKSSLLLQAAMYVFVGALVLGTVLAWFDFRTWWMKREVIPRAHECLAISWGISEILKVIISFFTLAILANLFLALLKYLFFRTAANNSMMILVQAFFLDSAVFFLIVSTILKKGSQLRDLLGFEFLKIDLKEVWLGVRTYLVILPLFMLVLVLLMMFASWIHYEPAPHPLVHLFMAEKALSIWMISLSLVLACLIGPVVEEIFFRGFFYPALKKYCGSKMAMCATAILFAAVHENTFAFFPIFFLGLTLTYLYEKRQSLIACISLHAIHNTVFIVYFFIVKTTMFGGS